MLRHMGPLNSGSEDKVTEIDILSEVSSGFNSCRNCGQAAKTKHSVNEIFLNPFSSECSHVHGSMVLLHACEQ